MTSRIVLALCAVAFLSSCSRVAQTQTPLPTPTPSPTPTPGPQLAQAADDEGVIQMRLQGEEEPEETPTPTPTPTLSPEERLEELGDAVEEQQQRIDELEQELEDLRAQQDQSGEVVDQLGSIEQELAATRADQAVRAESQIAAQQEVDAAVVSLIGISQQLSFGSTAGLSDLARLTPQFSGRARTFLEFAYDAAVNRSDFFSARSYIQLAIQDATRERFGGGVSPTVPGSGAMAPSTVAPSPIPPSQLLPGY